MCMFSCILLLVSLWSVATFDTLPSHWHQQQCRIHPLFFLRCFLLSVAMQCEMQFGYMYLQDHYACWLNRKQFFTLVSMNMNMNTHSVYVVYDITKWCCIIWGAKSLRRSTFSTGGIQSHSPVCILCPLQLHVIYNIQSLNSMHICREKNEYVYIVYYQQFWFYIEWLVVCMRSKRERGSLRAAKVIASIYISTSSNREMIYRKSALTLQMLHFILHSVAIPLSHHCLLASMSFVQQFFSPFLCVVVPFVHSIWNLFHIHSILI